MIYSATIALSELDELCVNEGPRSFVKSWIDLLACIASKSEALQ